MNSRFIFCLLILFSVQTTVVYAEDVVDFSQMPELRALLKAKHSTVLSSEFASKITQLSVEEGDRFKKGQLLLAFNCAEQQAQLKKVKAVAQAAKKTYQVNGRLVKLNSISQLEYELAAAELAKARADIQYISAILKKCRINAPFSGRVAERLVNRYQYVKAGDPLLDIVDDQQLEVTLLIPSSWLKWVKADMPFSVFLEEKNREYPAVIKKIGARIDAVSQSIKIIAIIDGEFNDLLPGMSGTARFPRHSAQ